MRAGGSIQRKRSANFPCASRAQAKADGAKHVALDGQCLRHQRQDFSPRQRDAVERRFEEHGGESQTPSRRHQLIVCRTVADTQSMVGGIV